MGAYVYCLKSPLNVHEITLQDDRTVKAGILKYSHKPYYDMFDRKEPAWQVRANNRIRAMEKAWGNATPEFVVVGDKLKEGAGVLDWHSQTYTGLDWDDTTKAYAAKIKSMVNTNCVSTCDDPNWGGRKMVGQLKKVGKTWTVVPLQPYVPTMPSAG